ncbi:MAG: hypothetical protein A2Z83_01150 [Omnitrophica bacterium GWA2_52_8]|nr:MAG: hypothetical protein A2Z83_01150 [Omnitrophica bacterium GWA2_52_8]
MTYKRLFYLKYKKGVPTYELVRRFPAAINRVTDVALLEVPEGTLREIIQEEKDWHRLMQLKQKFSNYL